jgi:hypothetical protein
VRLILSPEVEAVFVTAGIAVIGWSIVTLFRIARDVGDTQRKVDTMWQWWLLHVSKITGEPIYAVEKPAGYTPGGAAGKVASG